MATSSKSQVLSLYKMLLKESKQFSSYNYRPGYPVYCLEPILEAKSMRTYALRRVRDAFRENKSVDDPKTLEILLNRAWDSLAVIQRQVAIGKLYSTQKIVMEAEGMKKAS